jgi:hypothetical protein
MASIHPMRGPISLLGIDPRPVIFYPNASSAGISKGWILFLKMAPRTGFPGLSDNQEMVL